jgi:hypothetical protein
MRRCLSLFIGLVSCLAASPAAFAMIAAPRPEVREHFTLTVTGTLHRVVPAVRFPDGRDIYVPDHLRAYWTVASGGRTYRLDFSQHNENQVLAGLLLHQRVVVTGERQADGLRVLKLKADPAEKPIDQVRVEAVGKLRWRIYRASDGELLAYCDRLPSPFPKGWGCSVVLSVAGKHEPLTLPNDALRTHSEALVGQLVKVTGTPKNGAVEVSTLEAADGSWVHKRVRVEVLGELVWNRPPRCLGGEEYSVVAAGKSYNLRFRDEMLRNLRPHVGKLVLVTGTLQTGRDGNPVLLVSRFEVKSGYIKETEVQVEIKGTLTCEWISLAIWPPRPASPLFTVQAEGKTYYLSFASKELKEKALKLQGATVLLRGTLVNGMVKVTTLAPAGDG